MVNFLVGAFGVVVIWDGDFLLKYFMVQGMTCMTLDKLLLLKDILVKGKIPDKLLLLKDFLVKGKIPDKLKDLLIHGKIPDKLLLLKDILVKGKILDKLKVLLIHGKIPDKLKDLLIHGKIPVKIPVKDSHNVIFQKLQPGEDPWPGSTDCSRSLWTETSGNMCSNIIWIS